MTYIFFPPRASAAILSVLMAGLAISSCARAPSPPRAPSASLPSSASPFGRPCTPQNGESAAVRDLKAKIHAYTNAKRRQHGSGALALTCERGLTTVADAHSDWMAKSKKISHRNNRGQEPKDRVVALYPSYLGWVAENLGVISTSYSGAGASVRAANYAFDPDEMARRFVNGWMNSPGHRKNLLHPGMTHLGIGVAVRGTSVYVTQVFADPAA